MLARLSQTSTQVGSDTYAGQYSSAARLASANLTDFLFGARNNYSLNAVNEVNYQRHWHMGYIQDD